MMGRLGAVFSVVVLSSQLTPAAEEHDFLVLSHTSPLVLRLHVLVDGQPAETVRTRYFDQLFADLDRDRDGFLSAAEMERAPSTSFLVAFLHGEILDTGNNTARFGEVDRDADRRVSRREFDAYYRGAALDRIRVVTGRVAPDLAKETATIFDLLDRDADGALSRAELRGAWEALRLADFNGDEWLTRDEIQLLQPTRSKGAPRQGAILIAKETVDDPKMLTKVL